MFTAMTEPVRDLTSNDMWDAVRRRDKEQYVMVKKKLPPTTFAAVPAVSVITLATLVHQGKPAMPPSKSVPVNRRQLKSVPRN